METEERKRIESGEVRVLKLSQLVQNTGQIPGLPANPRSIQREKFELLKENIRQHPEFLGYNTLKVFPWKDGKYVVIGGNMRHKALKELGYKELPCSVIDPSTPVEDLKAYTILDNSAFGQWDWDLIANEWDIDDVQDWGIDIPIFSEPDEDKDTESENNNDNDEEKEKGDDSLLKDVLYPSDNDYDIPTLLLQRQAGKVELPLSPWGANSRLRKGVSTYHFYVDDYRFNALFKNPAPLLTSGCRAIVEPNCSLHDQTPIAYGLSLIYKKRWLARHAQECGIDVYADLNVSHKFTDFNKLGIPKGYNAFFTRGLIGWEESLKRDLEVAQVISELEQPNLIVYGGGKDIKRFCQIHGLMYVTDFVNAKKEK